MQAARPISKTSNRVIRLGRLARMLISLYCLLLERNKEVNENVMPNTPKNNQTIPGRWRIYKSISSAQPAMNSNEKVMSAAPIIINAAECSKTIPAFRLSFIDEDFLSCGRVMKYWKISMIPYISTAIPIRAIPGNPMPPLSNWI